MTDRNCNAWTSTRPESPDRPGAKTTQEAAPGPPATAAAAAAPAPSSSPPAAADRGPKARKTNSPHRTIPVTVFAADRKRRTIMVTPTSQQDAFYYGARRNVGVGTPPW